MANRITAASEGTERRQAPRPDITVMRETVQILLDPDAVVLPPAADELETLTQTIRGHLELLIPEVEQSVRLLKKDSIPRYCALACVGEARGKLRAEPSRRFGAEVGHARRLARTLNALCDHYENLGRAPVTTAMDDISMRSAECALASRDGYEGLHDECRQTKDIPLPHGAGLILVRHCDCPCHARIAGVA